MIMSTIINVNTELLVHILPKYFYFCPLVMFLHNGIYEFLKTPFYNEDILQLA